MQTPSAHSLPKGQSAAETHSRTGLRSSSQLHPATSNNVMMNRTAGGYSFRPATAGRDGCAGAVLLGVATPSDDELRAALSRHELTEVAALPGRTNHLRAGVLVPLRWIDDDVRVILTLRSPHLSTHAGEISFPGGRVEEEDVNLEATAVREAREEIGLEDARVLGRLSSIPLYTSDYRLEPYVAHIPRHAELTPCPNEVSAIVDVSIRETLALKYLHGIPWTHDGQDFVSPIFEHETKPIFGGTAYALYELLQVIAPLFCLEVPPLQAGTYEWSDMLNL